MQIPLSPYLLNITPVLLALEASPDKKVPKYQKETFREDYTNFLSPHCSKEELVELIRLQKPVYLSLVINRKEYLYWFSLKLSIASRDGIQTILNIALNNYHNIGFLDAVKTVVLSNLEKNWKWATISNVNEVKSWLLLTGDVFNSIFTPEYRELAFLELERRLCKEGLRDELFQLIYYNKTPNSKIILNYKDMKGLCLLFSLLRGKKQINLSYSNLAKWVHQSFTLIDLKLEETEVSVGLIETYLGSKYDVPEHLKLWFPTL